jgi:glucose/arabinose dehydrogenase
VRRLFTAVAGAVAVALSVAPGATAELPPGFEDEVVYEGLKSPTSVSFAPDGRAFVTEKNGMVLAFGARGDAKPKVVADLRRSVHSFNERGLMSGVLDPAFPRRPYMYVGYTYNAPLGGVAPIWGMSKGGKRKGGPEGCLGGRPDLGFALGCPASSRVSRLTLTKGGKAIAEDVLLEDWCQQFSSHSIGDLAFDRSGALLVGGGDGAYFDGPDVGKRGYPANACGDPPLEGGALRAQDLVTPGDPVTLDGTVARISPVDGSPAFGNPSAAPGNEGRIVAYGLRNPFRFAVRPNSDELWIADVGWTTAEEIIAAPLDRVTDFGWPCFEGRATQRRYVSRGTSICNTLYANHAVAPPWFAYRHGAHVAEGESCPASLPAAISGVTFDRGARFPSPFDGALLFADYIRGCIWAVAPERFGRPERGAIQVFETNAAAPIDLESGPGGTWYVDIASGAIHQITYARPTAEVRLRTRPPGLRVGIDWRTELDGTAVTVRAGSEHRVFAAATQARDGRRFRFLGWSDHGSRSHGVTVGEDSTLTATYECVKHCGGKGGKR